MKNLIKTGFLFIILQTANTISAQPYKSIFGNAKTCWNISFEQGDWYNTDSLIATTDTIINSLVYQIIEQPTGYFYKFQKYYIREDTNTGKYYIRNIYEMQNEYLFMDLSLQIGDTFIIHNRSYFSPDSIAVVDSVYYINDSLKVIRTNHNITTIGSLDNYLCFYESIGPNNGINYMFQELFIHFHYFLLCQFKNDTLYFHNPLAFETEPCHFSDGGYVPENDGLLLGNIYPNPVNQTVNLVFIKNYTGTIIINNLLGETLVKEYIFGKEFCTIDVTDLPSGIYIISLLTEKNQDNLKIIKL